VLPEAEEMIAEVF